MSARSWAIGDEARRTDFVADLPQLLAGVRFGLGVHPLELADAVAKGRLQVVHQLQRSLLAACNRQSISTQQTALSTTINAQSMGGE